MSGGYKNVFTQGVLKAFEEKEFSADVYAGCSSSALLCACAAIKKMNQLNVDFWLKGYNISQMEGNTQSDAMLSSINALKYIISQHLWESVSKRLLIATSFVNNEFAASQTQTDKARRLGQKLLIDAMRKNSSWRDANLNLHIFDSYQDENTFSLTVENFSETVYATTRMLHAWHIPAFIENKPYIDGSYTTLCPVQETIELGYKKIICIVIENNDRNYDFFGNKDINHLMDKAEIFLISPELSLKESGVDFYKIEGNSHIKVFNHGYEQGEKFLKENAMKFSKR